MTEEQKQALIDWLKEGIELREEYGFNGNLLASMRVALAALTAQPVKLPGISELIESNGCMPNVRDVSIWDEGIKLCAENIRAAGYQVKIE